MGRGRTRRGERWGYSKKDGLDGHRGSCTYLSGSLAPAENLCEFGLRHTPNQVLNRCKYTVRDTGPPYPSSTLDRAVLARRTRGMVGGW